MGLFSYDKFEAIGTLGRDPELRYKQDGTPICNFSIAVDRGYTDKQTRQYVKRTMWIRVSTYGSLAEMAHKRMNKGSKVFVAGPLSVDYETGGPRTWQGEDGTTRTSFEMTARDLVFLPGNNSGKPKAQAQAQAPMDLDLDDEVPF